MDNNAPTPIQNITREDLEKTLKNINITVTSYAKTGIWQTMKNLFVSAAVSATVSGFVALSLFSAFSSQIPNAQATEKTTGAKAHIARIHINGLISREQTRVEDTNADKIVSYFTNAKQNNIEGYIVVINSGGGYVTPSKEIADKVLETRAGTDGKLGTGDDIPVVMLIKDIGASGAYMIACAGERIIADETSIVGSIGVRASHVEYHEILKKIGIKTEEFSKGKYKTLGTPTKEMTEEEKAVLNNKLEATYRMFMTYVARNRNMKESEVATLATGETWDGTMAQKMKLVDELGGIREVEAYLKQKLGKELDIRDYKEQQNFWDRLERKLQSGIQRIIVETLERTLEEKQQPKGQLFYSQTP